MRLGDDGRKNKVLLTLAGEALLRRTVRVFQLHPAIQSIRIIARTEDFDALGKALADTSNWTKLGAPIPGGEERQDSVRLGTDALARQDPPDWVLVHDGARPLCSQELVQRVLESLAVHEAVVPVLPVFDTVRSATASHVSSGVVDRAGLRLTQTPQGFRWNTLRKAHERALQQGLRATDDAKLVEAMGIPVALVPGERRNLKITVPEDLDLAEWIADHPEWGRELPVI